MRRASSFQAAAGLVVFAAMAGQAAEIPREPCVVLSHDATGDFGPQTPNTKTCGWQEAIDACVEQGRDLYVKGGWGGRKAVYNVAETIRIPATQDFRIDGGIYVLNWTGAPDQPDKDLMRIDSTMNGEYHFGIFVYGGAGAALRIRPENPVPIDGFPAFIETEIKSQGLADPAPFSPGERKAGTGLVLDGGKAAITCSRFDFIGGILNFKTCIETTGNIVQNHFDCQHLHTNATNSTLFRIGPDFRQNVLRLAIAVDQGATDVKGLDVLGRNNTFEIMLRGGFPRGNDIVLGATADGNRLDLIHGKTEFDPADFITDNAQNASNEITWTGTLPAYKFKANAGDFSYTQRLFPATVRLSSGTLASLIAVRGKMARDYSSAQRSDILLNVGDQLRATSADPFEIEIFPLKLR